MGLAHTTSRAAWLAWARLKFFLTLPTFEGAKLTSTKLFNLYLSRFEANRLQHTVRSYPIKLTLEPTNVCNLRCPACLTGDGQVGRERGAMSLELYRKLLDELGDYLFQIEFANWGEPLLSKHICSMFTEASKRGISTTTSTNFNIPLDAQQAERLVSSGLHMLGVSIDGARQETYAQYRVRGSLDTVLNNCRAVLEAKRRLNSRTPRVVWDFHVFPHNVEDIALARDLAQRLGMDFAMHKGWVVGQEWDPGGDFHFYMGNQRPFPCLFLWQFAVVNHDGGVAPCCGAFYREDDVGQIAMTPDQPGSATFHEVWNAPRFQEARRLYRARNGSSEEAKSRICYECPNTIAWDNWRKHQAAGGTAESFNSGHSSNDGFNYFWNRQPKS